MHEKHLGDPILPLSQARNILLPKSSPMTGMGNTQTCNKHHISKSSPVTPMKKKMQSTLGGLGLSELTEMV